MADAHESLGQDVLQEAPDQFFATEAQGLVPAAAFVVLVVQADPLAVDGLDT